jgi:hypothetical protein
MMSLKSRFFYLCKAHPWFSRGRTLPVEFSLSPIPPNATLVRYFLGNQLAGWYSTAKYNVTTYICHIVRFQRQTWNGGCPIEIFDAVGHWQ